MYVLLPRFLFFVGLFLYPNFHLESNVYISREIGDIKEEALSVT